MSDEHRRAMPVPDEDMAGPKAGGDEGCESYYFPLAYGLVCARDTARRYLLKQITVTTAWMPTISARRKRVLTRYFELCSFCGEEPFYFLAVPVYMWFCDSGNAVPLVLLFLANIYLGNWLKNLFGLPRPPPAMRSAKCSDYGWPSTHSMNAVALPFYLLRCAFPIAVWEYEQPWRMWLCGAVATTWALSVSLSRVYLGVHSPADVQGGMMIGAVVLRLWLSVHRSLHLLVVGAGVAEASVVAHGAAASAASADAEPPFGFFLWLTLGAVLAIMAHPVVSPRTNSFAESVSTVSFGYGFIAGTRLARGNLAVATTAEHMGATNVLACVVSGGLIIGVTKMMSGYIASAMMRYGPTRRLVHALLVGLPLCALLRSCALVDIPTKGGALFTCMCAAVYCSEVGEGMLSPRPVSAPSRWPAPQPPRALLRRLSSGASSADAREQAGGDSVEEVIGRFINYASCGLALTLGVPAAFSALGLR